MIGITTGLGRSELELESRHCFDWLGCGRREARRYLLGERANYWPLKDRYAGDDESCNEYKDGFVRRLCFALGDFGWNDWIVLLMKENS